MKFLKILKTHKAKLIVCLIAVTALLIAFWNGGTHDRSSTENPYTAAQKSTPGENFRSGNTAQTKKAAEAKNNQGTLTDEISDNSANENSADTHNEITAAATNSTSDDYTEAEPIPQTDTNRTERQSSSNTADAQASHDISESASVDANSYAESDAMHTCTLSVSCASVLSAENQLNPEKAGQIPSDGFILPPTEVAFYDGESVFNLLLREMKSRKIHLEFRNVPIHNSAYILGINNLYETDCGELSGWMYKVNGAFPNYGCSRCTLSPNDTVEWLYTCDLGADIGGRNNYE